MRNNLRVISLNNHKPRDYSLMGATRGGRVMFNWHRVHAVLGQVLQFAAFILWFFWPTVAFIVMWASAIASVTAVDYYRKFWLDRIPPACSMADED